MIGPRGFARLRPEETRAALGPSATDAALADFVDSWDRLEVDAFMADGGRYRKRRIANFLALPGDARHLRGLHRPHFQAKIHNGVNGGVDRWFAACEDAAVANPVCQALLALGRAEAERLSPPGAPLFCEMHQFRIAARAGEPGHPTPEGLHRDGVAFVLIAMIRRENLAGGETLVADAGGRELARFTLDGALDALLADDARTMHGVTAISPRDPSRPSRRDVLVLTWKPVAA